MKNKFSFSRIGLMLKADWIEYNKAFLLFAGLLVAANLFLFLQMARGFQIFLFIAGIFSALTVFYIFTGWKVHRAKNRMLTLPANTLEKFVEILIIFLILFSVYFLIYTILVYIAHLTSGEAIWLLSVFDNNADPTLINTVTGFVLFVCAFQFMCCIAIRKYALGVGTLFLFVYAMVIAYSTYLLVEVDGFNIDNKFNFHSGFIRSNAMIEMMRFIYAYNTLCICIAAVVLIYISYLKLKEKQIR